MRSQKNLLIEQLEHKLQSFRSIGKIPIPPEGWIKAIRTTLNMNLTQLANRLKVDYQSVQGYEERERDGKITIKTLKEVGEALEMKFVYGFVPIHGSVKKMVNKSAKELAKKIVLRTHKNMLLENQGTDPQQIKKAIDELSQELERDLNKSLWN